MNNRLKEYIDSLFANAPQTPQTQEFKEEMLVNIMDKYNDLIAEGKSEEEAYQIAIAGIGDVSALIGAKTPEGTGAQAGAAPVRRTRNALITAIAVVLYMLCWLPTIFVHGISGVLLMFDIAAVATALLIVDSPKREQSRSCMIAVAAALYILCVTPLMALGGSTGLLLMFLMIAAATGLLVYNSSSHRDEAASMGAADGSSMFAEHERESIGNSRCRIAKTAAALIVVIAVALLVLGGWRTIERDDDSAQFLSPHIVDNLMDPKPTKNPENWSAQDASGDISNQDGSSTNPQSTQVPENWSAQDGAGVTGNDDERKQSGEDGMKNDKLDVLPRIGSASVPAAEIDQIEIEWVAGKVDLVLGEGSDITFSETSKSQLTDRSRLRYNVREGKLSISYCQDTWKDWSWLDFNQLSLPRKDLTVTIPESFAQQLRELEVDSVSGKIVSTGVFADEMDFTTVSGSMDITGAFGKKLSVETVSGAIAVTECNVRELDVETGSGKVTVTGKAEDVEMQSVSGRLDITLHNTPKMLDVETVSGSFAATLPQSAGDFAAKLDTVSGSFKCDFPTVQNGNRYVAGTGENKYKFSTVSGSIALRMAAVTE